MRRGWGGGEEEGVNEAGREENVFYVSATNLSEH